MEMLLTSFFWVTLAQITMINILLSGDNAVVIALASRSLPPKQQKKAIIFGSIGAIVLRLILTFFAVVLLELPYLKIIGALLLIWIGIKMLLPQDEETELDAHSNLWAAVKTIIIADLVMSLDNVIGVAAAAKGNLPLLIIGLMISIPLIIYGSTLVLKLMNRFPIIITAGGGLLGWVAGEMLVSDPAIHTQVQTQWPWAHTVVPVLATLLVIGVGKWLSARHNAQNQTDAAPAETIAREDPPTERLVSSAGQVVRSPTAESASSTAPIARASLHGDDIGQAPVGYHWVSTPWRTRPDGTRDYAAMHGTRSFHSVAPVSAHIKPPRAH